VRIVWTATLPRLERFPMQTYPEGFSVSKSSPSRGCPLRLLLLSRRLGLRRVRLFWALAAIAQLNCSQRLLFAVAGFVLLSSGLALFGYCEAKPTFAGITLLIVAAIGMPWLAGQKRKLAAQVASASLRADATESALCGYLSLIALAGLLTNAIFHAHWADPIAALALVPLIVREAWLAVSTSRHCCA